ncbi:hypothetical protein [Streptomyces sp. NPDC049881]|uniref:hypothetical protein n=1 Tax=Streptomyces sp. NPDC049881 TaxID=3155778 RepID=UPI003426944C
MNAWRDNLAAAIAAYNKAERAEFCTRTGLTWLKLDGPTYLIGNFRIKALFEDPTGCCHWADAALYAESRDAAEMPRDATAALLDVLGCMDRARDLWVHTDTRGQWNASLAPVYVIAQAFGEPEPERLPGDQWARTWWDDPHRSDAAELAWLAHGGQAFAPVHARGQL